MEEKKCGDQIGQAEIKKRRSLTSTIRQQST
jgi:hypothetical protein